MYLCYWRSACWLEEGLNVKHPGTVIYFQSSVCTCTLWMCVLSVCVGVHAHVCWADRINHFHFSELSLHSPCLSVSLYCGLACYPLNFFPEGMTNLKFILLIFTCTIEQPKHYRQNLYSNSLCVLIFKHKKDSRVAPFVFDPKWSFLKMLWDNVFHSANSSILFKWPITVLLSTTGSVCVWYYRSHDSPVMFCSCLTVAGSWLRDSTRIQTEERTHTHIHAQIQTGYSSALQNLRIRAPISAQNSFLAESHRVSIQKQSKSSETNCPCEWMLNSFLFVCWKEKFLHRREQEWVSEWVSERMSEWVSERMSEWVWTASKLESWIQMSLCQVTSERKTQHRRISLYCVGVWECV